MIAGCPKCNARYRVDADRIGSDGAKLRCTKCSAVFLVRAPRATGESAPASEQAAVTAPPLAVQSQTSALGAAEGGPEGDCRVLIADPDEERAKMTASAVEAWGLVPLVVHDGVEAMLTIARMQPRAVVLDAALPKMYGFQVCEVVKRMAKPGSTCVVLVGAIHEETRYRSNPSDLYGADVYLEQPDLPNGLHPLLREAGLPVSDAPARSEVPRVEPTPTPTPSPVPVASSVPAALGDAGEDSLEFETEPPTGPAAVTEAPPSVAAPDVAPAPAASGLANDSEDKEEIERAERLARIAVSEMVLYQPDKFDQAAREGNLSQALELEIQEAQALIRQRVSESVRNERDFIEEELMRVARDRGAIG